MKRILLLLFVMLTVKTTVLADGATDISAKAKASFEKEFAGAEIITWNNLGEYQMAVFTFNSHLVEAYFNTETGELKGAARYLLFDQLPLNIIRAYDKSFIRSDFMSVLEVSNTEGTFYRFVVETQDKRYSAKISTDGNLLHLLKINKK